VTGDLKVVVMMVMAWGASLATSARADGKENEGAPATPTREF
jgi:hypothetical protein